MVEIVNIRKAIIFTVAFIASTRDCFSEYVPAITSGSASYAHQQLSCNSAKQVLPFSTNLRDRIFTSSITYPKSKGDILIHKPATIVVKRPPTQIVVNHPSLVVRPAPVIFHKPPAIVVRKVAYKKHPKQVKVEPVFVSVVKPAATEYYLNEHQQKNYLASSSLASYNSHSDSSDSSNSSHSAPGDSTIESMDIVAPYFSKRISSSELGGHSGQPVDSAANYNDGDAQYDNKKIIKSRLPTLSSLIPNALKYSNLSAMD